MKLALRLIIAGAGLALFAWFVHRTGVDTISRAFATLGWSAPLILLPYALVYFLDTVGWRLSFGCALPKAISFGTLFRIRWAGEALNNVVPSAYLGGEAMKVYLLHKRGLPVADGTTSVIIGKTAQVLAEVIFIAFGAVAGSSILPAASPARAGMFAIAGAATALVGMLFWLQHRGIFSAFLALTERLRLRIHALTSRADRSANFRFLSPGSASLPFRRDTLSGWLDLRLTGNFARLTLAWDAVGLGPSTGLRGIHQCGQGTRDFRPGRPRSTGKWRYFSLLPFRFAAGACSSLRHHPPCA